MVKIDFTYSANLQKLFKYKKQQSTLIDPNAVPLSALAAPALSQDLQAALETAA